MPRRVFERIEEGILGQGSFVQRYETLGKPGIHPLCRGRLVSCLRLLANGNAADGHDKVLEMSETVSNDALKEFAFWMVKAFSPEYLNRCPTAEEKKMILEIQKSCGWPGAFASWDCKHFEWETCQVRLAGQMKGHLDGGKNTLILDAIADPDLYLWYVFFGECGGSLNDINVLDKSSIVRRAIISGTFDASVEEYVVNGTSRDWLYFLVDGIYPDWSIFVKSINAPITEADTKFAQMQESVRKDVERAFGVLVKRFHYLKRPFRNWYLADIRNILHCCIIIHNMIFKARRGGYMPVQHGLNKANEDAQHEGAVACILCRFLVILPMMTTRSATMMLQIHSPTGLQPFHTTSCMLYSAGDSVMTSLRI